MTYLLDTDVFTLAYFDKAGLRGRIRKERSAGYAVAVSVVTWGEVLRGRIDAVLKAADGAALTRAHVGLRSSQAYLDEFSVMPIEAGSAATFDRLRADLKVRKRGLADVLIACVALAHGAVLVTRNVADFAAVPGLRVDNWAG